MLTIALENYLIFLS